MLVERANHTNKIPCGMPQLQGSDLLQAATARTRAACNMPCLIGRAIPGATPPMLACLTATAQKTGMSRRR